METVQKMLFFFHHKNVTAEISRSNSHTYYVHCIVNHYPVNSRFLCLNKLILVKAKLSDIRTYITVHNVRQ